MFWAYVFAFFLVLPACADWIYYRQIEGRRTRSPMPHFLPASHSSLANLGLRSVAYVIDTLG